MGGWSRFLLTLVDRMDTVLHVILQHKKFVFISVCYSPFMIHVVEILTKNHMFLCELFVNNQRRQILTEGSVQFWMPCCQTPTPKLDFPMWAHGAIMMLMTVAKNVQSMSYLSVKSSQILFISCKITNQNLPQGVLQSSDSVWTIAHLLGSHFL